jgi:hypothetical protein
MHLVRSATGLLLYLDQNYVAHRPKASEGSAIHKTPAVATTGGLNGGRRGQAG